MQETSEDSIQNARPIYKSSVEKLEYQRKYALKNRERAREYAREYHRKNRDKQKSYFKERYKENPEKYKKLNRENYQKNREKILEQARIKRSRTEEKEKINQRRIVYYAKNKERLNKKSNQWAKDNRDRHYATALQWRIKHRDRINERAKEKNLQLKKEVFGHYGGLKCSCCGEPEFLFLTIDHINGDGAQHRKQIRGGGNSTYQWLRKNNYPSGYQVLCINCNMAKGKLSYCPVHQIPQNTVMPL